MKILVTGFDAFGEHETNPTQKIIENHLVDQKGVGAVVFNTSFKDSKEMLEKALMKFNPDVAIHFGVNARISHIAIERIALNIMHARIPDNKQFQPLNQTISEKHPWVLESTLPTQAILNSLKDSDIPAEFSFHAGTYVCNYVMYLSLLKSISGALPGRSGFIHMPPESDMDIETQFKAVDIIIDTIKKGA